MPDPVLNRPMFQGSTPSAPSAKGTGITSMVTPPDVAAEQLRSVVNPMKPIVQGFADGGPATSMWQRFVQSLTVPEPTQIMSGREPIDIGGREAVISPEVYDNMTAPTIEERRAEAKRNIESYEAPPPAPSPAGRYVQGILGLDEAGVAASRQRASEVSKRFLDREEEMRRFEKTRAELQRAREQNPPVSFWDNFSDITDEQVEERNKANRDAQEAILRKHRQEPDALTQLDMETGREAARARGLGSLVGAPGLPKGDQPINIDEGKKTEPQRQATSDVGLNLQQIKADREAKSSADRRENALLALMNAGFAMAAGKSPHALQNIGAGGQAGIQAFAEMEKQRRDTEYKQYLQDLHERELRMRQAEQAIKAPLYKAQAEYYTSRPEAERQRQQVRERAAEYAARKEAANEFIRRKKDDFNFAQQFNNPATGAAMEKEWITRRTQELLPEMRVIEQNKDNNAQGNVSPINAE